MIFNSIEFLIFFVALFFIYHFLLKEKTKLQNILLLIASYLFYAWTNWKILPLIALTTSLFYFLGIAIFDAKTDKRKYILMIAGILFGIGTLLYFKYFNFFILSFKNLFELFELQTNIHTFKILVPVGISFYTFRLLSYIIDIHRDKIEPTRDILAFSTYVAFFPCLLAGPIDRPATLISQLKNKRIFNHSLILDGLRQILWGLFKKMVIADNCAIYVNQCFENIHNQTGITLLLSALFYSFQMYADFSGYSDMAIGVAKLLGFRVTRNFDFPFFAQNIAEFWRKWHISLTSWLTDYLFMPLNIKFRNIGKCGIIFAIIINFVICGLWHGDNWTFVLWGLYHGLLFIPLILSGTMFKKKKIETFKWGFPKPKILLKILLTFALVTGGLILFRADNIGQAFDYFINMIDKSLFPLIIMRKNLVYQNLFFIFLMLIIEWLQRNNQHGLELNRIKSHIIKFAIYYFLITTIFIFAGQSKIFIYFQF